jgi:hypothetical protein
MPAKTIGDFAFLDRVMGACLRHYERAPAVDEYEERSRRLHIKTLIRQRHILRHRETVAR